jgi:hypothetical protein
LVAALIWLEHDGAEEDGVLVEQLPSPVDVALLDSSSEAIESIDAASLAPPTNRIAAARSRRKACAPTEIDRMANAEVRTVRRGRFRDAWKWAIASVRRPES